MFDPLDWPMMLQTPARLTSSSSWVEHIPFGMALVQMLRPGLLVELGTQRGDSYCAFCQAVSALKLPTRCFAIDTFASDANMPMSAPQIVQELRGYHDPRYGAFSTIVQTTFDQALPSFDAGGIDLLHIDGDHRYESVRHDFDSWLPKVSRKAVVLFHDTAEKGREGFGVWKFWEEVAARYPSFEFTHEHGLGVLGVGADLPASALEFFEQANHRPDAMRQLFQTLGSRISLIRTLHVMVGLVNQQRGMVNEWRQLTQQPATTSWDPAAAVADPAGFLVQAIRDVEQLAQDDIRLRQHIGRMSADAARLKSQLDGLSRQQSSPTPGGPQA